MHFMLLDLGFGKFFGVFVNLLKFLGWVFCICFHMIMHCIFLHYFHMVMHSRVVCLIISYGCCSLDWDVTNDAICFAHHMFMYCHALHLSFPSFLSILFYCVFFFSST